GELALVAQPFDEMHPDVRAVQVPVEVEQVHFLASAWLFGDRRTDADVHHAAAERARARVDGSAGGGTSRFGRVEAIDDDRVDAVLRDELEGLFDVRGRKSDRAAAGLASRDDAGERVKPREDVVRVGEIAAGERVANARARVGALVVTVEIERAHREPERG